MSPRAVNVLTGPAEAPRSTCAPRPSLGVTFNVPKTLGLGAGGAAMVIDGTTATGPLPALRTRTRSTIASTLLAAVLFEVKNTGLPSRPTRTSQVAPPSLLPSTTYRPCG